MFKFIYSYYIGNNYQIKAIYGEVMAEIEADLIKHGAKAITHLKTIKE